MNYDHKKIERKWQRVWQQKKIYFARDKSKRSKKYVLIEFPYPSGEGLHMGHLRPYVAGDVYSRFQRMKGFETMYPIGWDAFGLPAENFAIKKGIHPRITTKQNIANAKKQLESWGMGFDWSREINTTDPEYYKWTQWIFLQFYKAGLAYEAVGEINWCPKDKTGLANEEVIDGRCERCGTIVEKKKMRQWYLKITAYAEKLLKGLKTLDWPEHVKLQQENWIGKSEGAEIEFRIKSHQSFIKVFTTRPDTIFGATYMVLAPEHELISNLESRITNHEEIKKYIQQAKKKTELQRTAEEKEKTGVELKGIKAINPATKEEIPVWTADYVLMGYGTGAIMAVPAHDERDFAFAKKYKLPIREVIRSAGLNCVLIHGCPPDPRPDRPFEQNWRLWVKKELETRGIQVYAPVMPNAWLPKYSEWKQEFEKISVNEQTVLVGNSCGAAFVVRWIGETKIKIKKLILVAPALVLKPGNESKKDLYDFEIDTQIKDYIGESVIFISNDEERHLQSAEIYKKALNARVVWLENRGHFTFREMNTNRFSELLSEIIEFEENSHLEAYTGDGVIINSEQYNGMDSREARMKMAKEFGKAKVQFKLRDWVFSRQRYWGEPIPVIHCDNCGIVPVPEDELPVKLPEIEKYEPTGTGESPLAAIDKWVNVKCPNCSEPAKRETNTMPQWAGSSWYYLRYTDPHNDKELADKKLMKHWLPVDVYFGGMEHTTLHLLYSRFWHLFLHDQRIVPVPEPYTKRIPHGIILGPDGEKMSKSRGNIVNPDEVVEKFGADALRMYELFLGPHEATVSWNIQGIVGVQRFLTRVYNFEPNDVEDSGDTHKLIKKIGDDIQAFKFNTAVAAFMEYSQHKNISRNDWEIFFKLLAPFAPHLAEELWHNLGHKDSIHIEPWPEYDQKLIQEEQVSVVVQVNGKHRSTILIDAKADQAAVESAAKNEKNVKKYIEGKEIRKVIYIQGKIINFVI